MDKDTLTVLVSCINQDTQSILQNTKITTNAVIVNQGKEDKVSQEEKDGNHFVYVDSSDTGLSNSRNLALQHANATIGLVCDDDEVLDDHYEETILKGYSSLSDADIIIFKMSNQPCKLKNQIYKLNKWDVLHVSSWQITFRIDSIKKKGLAFDPYMGAGTKNGASEEVKFLRDCLDAGLTIYYVPKDIGAVAQEESTWFKGYNKDFFYQRGVANRYMLGLFPALAYSFYYTLTKKKLYQNDLSFGSALYNDLRGVFSNDIAKQKKKDGIQ